MALVGLDMIHVAPITETPDGKVTYGTPVKLANAMDAKITPTQDTQNIYADDTVPEIISVFSNVDVEFTVSDIGSEKYGLLLGKQKDSNGVYIDGANDIAPYFAFGFRAKKSNGEYRMMWLYKGKFQPLDESYVTQADKADSQSQAVRGTFVKRADGKWRARMDSDDEGVTPAVVDSWFTKVYESPIGGGAGTASTSGVKVD